MLYMMCDELLKQLMEQYQLIGVLSNKNGATVMRIHHRVLGKDVIVKRYATVIPAYERLKTFRHENLPEILDSVVCEDGHIVLEEFIQGISVADVAGKYTYKGAKTVVIGVCKAVQSLHDLRIIHRDIKPENVMISQSGTVKLIDLNASRIPKGKNKDTVMLGTVGYASPEQLGVCESDERSDIYAIGVLLNVMLTGEHPSKLLAKGRAGKIVQKCTMIAPDSRFSSAYELIQAL